MRANLRLLLLLLACWGAMTAAASAQTADPDRGIRVDGDGHPYRPWDFAVSTGLHVDDDLRDRLPHPSRDDDWEGGWGVQAEVGRYWTSHLKTEGAVGLLTPRDLYGYETVVIQGLPAQAVWFGHVRRPYVSGAVTWQFLDNAFAHPFVSGGVRVHINRLHITRQPSAWSWAGVPQNLPLEPIDERTTELQARPYLAAGYKSYFYNERTYLRSEFSVGFGRSGLSQWALRLGVGVDF